MLLGISGRGRGGINVRVATYNVRNFFDRNQVGEYDGAKSDSEISAMVSVVDDIQADIIAFQEIESHSSMELLNDRLEQPFGWYTLVQGNYYRRLHLGYFSRYPFTTTSHRSRSLSDPKGTPLQDFANPDVSSKTQLKFQRDLLLAEFELGDGKNLSIFNLHLKSQSINDWRTLSNDQIRSAEAREAQAIIRAYDDGVRPVIVAGDFNEEKDDLSLRPLLHQLGYRDAIEEDWIGTYSPPYTYYRYPYHTRIDYLLLNDSAAEAYIDDSAWIRDGRDAKKASDHFPVTIDLEL